MVQDLMKQQDRGPEALANIFSLRVLPHKTKHPVSESLENQ